MRSNKAKWIVTTLALIILAVTMLAIIVKVDGLTKTKELGSSAYTIGALDESDGAEVKNEYAIRTGFQESNKFNKIELTEKAFVTYQVFYYNADKEYIGKSTVLSAGLTEMPKTQTLSGVSHNVKYYRVMVKVPESKDKVTLLNKSDYAKQITVTINK